MMKRLKLDIARSDLRAATALIKTIGFRFEEGFLTHDEMTNAREEAEILRRYADMNFEWILANASPPHPRVRSQIDQFTIR